MYKIVKDILLCMQKRSKTITSKYIDDYPRIIKPRKIDLSNISPLKWQYWFDELLQSDA